MYILYKYILTFYEFMYVYRYITYMLSSSFKLPHLSIGQLSIYCFTAPLQSIEQI